MKKLSFQVVIAAAVLSAATLYAGKEWKSGIEWPEPPVVEPGAKPGDPPSDAVVLFDGSDLSQWDGGDKWIVKDGYAQAAKGGITTKDKFGDMQLHIEFATPEKVSGNGQGRGNSGVYFFGKYECQILDSYDNPTYFDGQAAAIYKQSPPMVNASRKPGEWQAYDIIFNAPQFNDDGSLAKSGYFTVLHNGVLVQNHYELKGTTAWDSPPKFEKHGPKGKIQLQFHGNPVRYRNIWLRELKPLVGKLPEAKPKEEKKEEKPAETGSADAAK
ncbi:3-keto-disaccharide hydrolase [Blastopirellula marina]|uniref:Putative multi-domain protein n=1 Tax=Blastopirellula marina DSM 3645 TaxID=314230 RepID=A4A2E9_9BACT|nr:DUF1080 domain-containing protein [Blastopirellula marina]EAQ77063.1 putative multi-domain protein [Blastopirellula marina DSM 3645]